MRRRGQKIATRLDIAVMIVLFCALLALYIAVRPLFPEGGDLYVGLLTILLYLALLAIWAELRIRFLGITLPDSAAEVFESELVEAFGEMLHPVLLVNETGGAVYCNTAFLTFTGQDHIAAGTPFSSFFELVEENGLLFADFGERRCRLQRVPIRRGDRTYTFLHLYDETARRRAESLYSAERTVVAYAIIDNIEEILQYAQENYAETSRRVEDRLREWTIEAGGLFRAYDRNKYLMIFDNAQLERCLTDRFAILDEIRSIRVGDGMPITISLGVARLARGSLTERDAAAQYALDLALQRGGDQAVFRDEEKVSFFGGRTKAGYKRVNIKTRVVAGKLLGLISRAGNVLIMGHKYGDYDSFAACIGLSRIVASQDIRVNIVVNRDDPSLALCFERIASLSDYRGIFVDRAAALDLVEADTLVIAADVNNPSIMECSELMQRAMTVAVLDHHIKTASYNSAVKLEYIDTTASSACELVSEIIEHSVGAGVLRAVEAELMLSGVLLDTKRFTRNTGTRTFAVAQFLRAAGANPGDAFEFFKTTADDLEKVARFHTNVLIYSNRVAISSCDAEDVDSSYRIAAAKAADGLLGVKGVSASFALVRIEDTVYISARSDGSINVQVILEAFNGGGHFDVAGAQVENGTVESVVEGLRGAIDAYLKESK